MPISKIAVRQILDLAILFFLAGTIFSNHCPYPPCINTPESITGGLSCNVILPPLAGHKVVNLTFLLDLSNLQFIVFSLIGPNALLRSLVQGGLALMVLSPPCGVFLIYQHTISGAMTKPLGNSQGNILKNFDFLMR